MKRTALFFVFLFSSFVLFAQQARVDKIEPPFWWTGMHDPTLQLLVYGKDIASASVTINKPGVELVTVKPMPNKDYLVVNLKVSKTAQPGKFLIVFQTKNGNIERTYELKKRREHADVKTPFQENDAIYLITPDRFANGDTTNDTVAGYAEKANRSINYGRHGGDLKGMTEHLDYIKKLGMTAIWPMPLLENNQAAYTYHGYAISNFYQTDKRYGSNDDYKAFVSAAHQKGLKVLMDQVFNHCGSAHYWMKDMPSPTWINSMDSIGRCNFSIATISDPYASKSDLKRQVRGYFDTNMPDLNLDNPILAKYMIQNSIWWVEYANLDGLRIDTYPYFSKIFSAKWRQRIEEEYPGMFVVAEVWVGDVSHEVYWNRKGRNPDGYQSHLKSITDFPLYFATLRAFKKGGNVSEVFNTLTKDYLYGHPEMNMIFPDNHDVDRIMGDLNGDYNRLKLALSFMATTRGILQWYYGTEILMKGLKPDGIIREDMPGGWTSDTVNVFNDENLTSEQQNALDFSTRLLNWRKNSKAIASGKLLHFVPENNVYVYFRIAGSEKVMVVLNNNTEAQSLNTARFDEILKGVRTGINILTGDKINFESSLNIPPLTPYIIEL